MSAPWPATPTAVLTPVSPGHEAALTRVLTRLSATPDAFEGLAHTHLARLVVVGRLAPVPGFPNSSRPLRMRYLLFTALSNLSEDAFFEDLRASCRQVVDEVWTHCVGYPGAADENAFVGYMSRNALHPSQTFTAYDATVPEVRAALDLRKKHLALALSVQNASAEELRKAFRRQFCEDPGSSGPPT